VAASWGEVVDWVKKVGERRVSRQFMRQKALKHKLTLLQIPSPQEALLTQRASHHRRLKL